MAIKPSIDLNKDLQEFSERVLRYQRNGDNGSPKQWYQQLGFEDKPFRDLMVSIGRAIALNCTCACHITDLVHPDSECFCGRE